jgi:hypothetical protein
MGTICIGVPYMEECRNTVASTHLNSSFAYTLLRTISIVYKKVRGAMVIE